MHDYPIFIFAALLIFVLTVLLSVFLHGISAVPLSRLYATHASNGGGN